MDALITDLGQVDSMYRQIEDSSRNASGSALKENEQYMKSLQARIGLARVEVEKLALSIGEAFLTEGMIQGIQMFGSMLGAITEVVKAVGALPVGFAVTGLALTLLSSKFKGLTVSISQSILGMLGFRTATTTTGTATTSLGARLTTLGTSMKAFVASTGLAGVAFVALGFAMEKLLGHFAKQRELQETIAQENREMTRSYKESSDEIDSLVSRYKTLQDTMRTGTDEQKVAIADEYLEVQGKLAELMPNLVKGEDDYGNAIIGNAVVIENKIKLIERQIEAEERRLAAENAKADKKNEKTEKIEENKLGQVEDYQLGRFEKKNNRVNTNLVDRYKGEIKSYEDMTKAIEHYEKQRVKFEQEGLTGKANAAAKTVKSLTDLSNLYLSVGDELSDARTKLAQRSFESTEKMILDNKNLSDSAKEMAMGIASTLATIGLESGSLEGIFDGLQSGLQDDGSLKLFIDSYEQSFNRLKRAQKEGLSTDDLEDYLEAALYSFDTVKNSILDTARANGVLEGSVEYANLEAELLRYSKANITSVESVQEMAKSTGQSEEQIKAMIMAVSDGSIEMGDFGEAVSEAAENIYTLESALEVVAGVSSKLVSDTEELLFIFEQLSNQQNLNAEQVDRLADAENKLSQMYPYLVQNGKLNIDMLRQESEAQSMLLKATEQLQKGKLTTDEKRALSGLQTARTEIHNINEQIKALDKLAAAYRKFTDASVQTAQELADAGLEDDAEDAFIRARKWSGFAKEQESTVGTYKAQLQDVVKTQGAYVNTLAASEAIAGKNKTATEKQTKAQKEAAKAMERSIFIADKYKRSLELLNLEIKKQQDIQANTPDYSSQHRAAIEAEIKLQKDKTDLLLQQEQALQAQIKSGKILQTGIVTTSSEKSQKLSGWDGRITSQMGARNTGIKGASTNHAGIDIAGAKGTRLDSNVSGKVIFAGSKGNARGNYVQIQTEDGMKHIYQHLDKVVATLGQTITAGMQIGTIGNTGVGSGSHLHYEVRDKSGKAVNPNTAVDAARKGVSSASKEAAQVSQSIDGAQSELISLQGQIMDQSSVVKKLEMDLINSKLSEFNERREKYQRVIEFEAVKIDTLDKSSARYVATLERTAQHLKYKQQVNQEELKFLEEQQKSGKLSALAMDANKVAIDDLKISMMSLGLEIQNTNANMIESTMLGFVERLDDMDYAIQRSQTITSLLEEGTAEYANEIKFQIDQLQLSKKEIKAQEDALKKLLKTKDLSIEKVKEYKEQLEDLSLAYLDVDVNIKRLKDSTNDFIADSLTKIKDELIDGLKKNSEEAVKSLEDQIKAAEDSYDSLIDKQKERLDALDEEIEKEDRLKKLQDIDNEIAKVKSLKNKSYITKDGEEILTYDKAKVSELEKQRDEMKQQFERDDIKKAINDEITRLEKAKKDRVDILRKEVEDTKAHYDRMIATEEEKWTQLIASAQKGTLEFDELMNEFYGTSSANLQNYVSDTLMKIQTIKDAYASLASLEASVPQSSGGGGSSSSSSSGNPLGMSEDDYDRYVWNKERYSNGVNKDKAAEENERLRDRYGIAEDKYSLDELKKYHTGGIIGETKGSRLSNLANKLFNAKPGEQVVKSLVGELQVPPMNIPNLFTNINSMVGSLFSKQQPQMQPAGDVINMNGVVIQADNPKQFFKDLDMHIRMNKR